MVGILSPSRKMQRYYLDYASHSIIYNLDTESIVK
jgi:hypothetical protein